MSKRLGASHALASLAGEGLRDDLFEAFGRDGDLLLAAAMGQIMSGGPMSSLEPELEGGMARELLGVASRLDPPRLTELTARLGASAEGMEDLFRIRTSRASGVLAYDITSVSTYGTMGGWADWGYNRDGERLRQVNVGLVTDMRGVPTMFELYPGPIADVSTLERTVERVLGFGAGSCVLSIDRAFGSAHNLRHLIGSGMPFVTPSRSRTRCARELVTRLAALRNDPDAVRVHGDEAYTVLECQVAVVPKRRRSEPESPDEDNDTADLELVLPDDPRFDGAAHRMTAHACYNARKAGEARSAMQKGMKRVEGELRAMEPWAAVKGLKRVAGDYARFFELAVEDGSLSVRVKRNALSAAMNKEGAFVMFSSGVGAWSDMMACYDCRAQVEQAFDALKNQLDGDRWRTADIVAARGRMTVKFVALIMWCEAVRRLKDARIAMPAATALQHLDNVMALGDGSAWRVTEVTAKNRKILAALGAPGLPKALRTAAYDYLPRAYQE
ncbi:MAG: transposase [Methanomassiliicoccaceae archaeon]|nr:transposase [Methanomassiliicoccaceae archaeon]